MLTQRQALLAHLKKSIIEVHEVYIPSARHPIGYIECPLQHEENCGPHVRLEDISETEDVHCSKSDGKVVPPEAYMMLLATYTGKGHIMQMYLQLLVNSLLQDILPHRPVEHQLAVLLY